METNWDWNGLVAINSYWDEAARLGLLGGNGGLARRADYEGAEPEYPISPSASSIATPSLGQSILTGRTEPTDPTIALLIINPGASYLLSTY